MNRIIDVSQTRIPSVNVPIDNGGGTAAVGDVKSGKTFTSSSGIGQPGSMPLRVGDTAALSSSVSSTTLKLLASDGYRDGVSDNVTITDANWLAANIPKGMSIFGLTGTGVNAKSWAKGTGSTGTGISGVYTATVSGLSFFPRAIFVFNDWVAAQAGFAQGAYLNGWNGVSQDNTLVYNSAVEPYGYPSNSAQGTIQFSFVTHNTSFNFHYEWIAIGE